MADPLQLYQFSQNLFDPVRRTLAGGNAARVQAAQIAAQRARENELIAREDIIRGQEQAARDAAAQRAAGLQLRLAELTADRADARARADFDRAELAIQSRERISNEARMKDLRNQIQAEYRAYRTAGGTKPLADFGSTSATDEFALRDMLSRLTEEKAAVGLETEASDIAAAISDAERRRLAVTFSIQKAAEEERDKSIKDGAAQSGGRFLKAFNKEIGEGATPAMALQSLGRRYPSEVRSIISDAENRAAAAAQATEQSKANIAEMSAVNRLTQMAMDRGRSPGVMSAVQRKLALIDPRRGLNTTLSEGSIPAGSQTTLDQVQHAIGGIPQGDRTSGALGAPGQEAISIRENIIPVRPFQAVPEATGVPSTVTQRGQRNRDLIADYGRRFLQGITPTSTSNGRLLFGINQYDPASRAIGAERLRERISGFDDPNDPNRSALIGQYIDLYGAGAGRNPTIFGP